MPFLDEDGVTRLTEDYLDIFAPIEELGEGDGTNAGPIYELSAKGHAEQFSTTGKNLLPNTATTQTVSGVTFTVNADGSVTANGTASAELYFKLYGPISLNSGTYVLDGCPSGGGDTTYFLFLQTVGGGGIIKDTGNGVTFTLDGSASKEAYLTVRNGVTVSNLTFYPQLELGSTATSYEPYTGGAPSPSPDYPQEIQVVRGRNLVFKTIDEECSIGVNGQIIASAGFKTHVAKVKNGEIYTILTDDSANFVGGFFTSEPSIGSISYNSSRIAGGSRTFASPIDGYVVFRSSSSYVTPQLTEGSTPQPYVPYGHVGLEVQGKNLLDESTLEQGGITSGGNVDGIARVRTAGFIPVTAGNTYAVSALSSLGTIQYAVNTYTAMQNNRYSEIAWTVAPSTFTVPADVSYVRIAFRIGGGNTSVSPSDLYAIQLTLGSTATPYEPYYHTTTPIPLPDRGWVGGLPDGTSDILTLDGAGKCEWELPMNEVVLDGSNLPIFTASNSIAAKSVDDKLNTGTTILMNFMSDHFIPGITVGEIYSYNKSIYMKMCAAITSQAECDAFFTVNPVTVLYPLATPIHESKGYIEDWPTDIPEGATITIPELDALNVKYFVANDSISQYANQWYERTKAVDISPVEDAVVELTENVIDLTTLDPIGGLERVSDGVRIGSLVQESNGYARGGLAQVTAKGHAEQFSTTGKNLCPTSQSAWEVGSINQDGTSTITLNTSRLRTNGYSPITPSTTYAISCAEGYLIVAIFEYSANDASSFVLRTVVNAASRTITAQSTSQYFRVVLKRSNDADVSLSDVDLAHPQLELGSTATEYEPYTGGAPSPSPDYPQEIQVVRGRNLLDADNDELSFAASAESQRGTFGTVYLVAGATYTFSCNQDSALSSANRNTIEVLSGGTTIYESATDGYHLSSGLHSVQFTTWNTGTYTIKIWCSNIGNDVTYSRPQLTLGSTPQPYVPYGHVGMEVRDPDTDELISCTALPLPQRGWVAGLSDGTADTLRIDGAGKCEWELKDGMETFDGSETWNKWSEQNIYFTRVASLANCALSSAVSLADRFRFFGPVYSGNQISDGKYGFNYSTGDTTVNGNMSFHAEFASSAADFKTWLSTHPVTVLYPLATPVTEDCGYVDMPDIPSDCTITIPELDALGIKYFVDNSVIEYGKQIHARAYAELGDAIVELTERVAELEQQ